MNFRLLNRERFEIVLIWCKSDSNWPLADIALIRPLSPGDNTLSIFNGLPKAPERQATRMLCGLFDPMIMISQGPWLLTLQIGVLSDMITASQELRTLHELQAVESRAFWNSFDLILHIDMLWYILDSHSSGTVTTIFEIGNYYWLVLSSHKILWCQLPIHEKCQLFMEHLNHMNHHVTLHQCICRY